MEYISSDTNVWIDFNEIDRVDLPFRLPYTYVMFYESVENELLYPTGLREDLIRAGLTSIDIDYEEFALAESWGTIYPKLSAPDRIALAIAKVRGITLLTGDGALRKAAQKEEVAVFGTIGVLDQLYGGGYVTEDEYRYCLAALLELNGGVVRLPTRELETRLNEVNSDSSE